MYSLTIYTATYNRADLLPRLYKSLCQQTCKDFIWMIIDDGSTDITAKLVQCWIREKQLEIHYYYKENGGVHTARDMAYRLAETDLITGCDSDDWLTDNAVDSILSFWQKNGGDGYSGIFAVTIAVQGKRGCSLFPNISAATYQDFTYKYRCKGDKLTVIRSNVIKQIPDLPAFPGEKLVGEGCKWIQLPNKPFLLLDKPIKVISYQKDGYSRNARKNMFYNPNGFRASHRQHIISSKYLMPRLKGHVGYIVFSLLLKDKHFIMNSPKPWVTLLFLPVGVAGYLYVIARWGKFRSGKTNGQ